jgi:hypothetical protein
VENPALGNDALDVASETVRALGVLHEMALAMGDRSTAARAARSAVHNGPGHRRRRVQVMQRPLHNLWPGG